MKLLRQPPRIKVLEAAGALGDRRVSLAARALPLMENRVIEATVASSDGSRAYDVRIARSGYSTFRVYSSDNGTLLRGYVGYPIIAVMMAVDLLPRDEYVEETLSGIPWRELNERFKKYSLVEEYIRSKLRPNADWRRVEEFRARVLRELRGKKLYLDKSLAPP